ncbi:MAG: rod shape-determining protein MreC [Pseudomonadota bacterium]
MARRVSDSTEYVRPVRRILIGLMLVFLIGLFLFWRIDSPRAERLRAHVIDTVVPNFDWVLMPLTTVAGMAEDFRAYTRIYEQNQELRRELQAMKAWKEAALQLEQQNAKLLDLNNVRLDPKLTFVTGVVLTDSGSPFRKSVLLNIGQRDGIVDGWAATDGLGLVGRISGVGPNTSRVILLTDSNSRLPVTIQASGQTALVVGDNTALPPLDFIEDPEQVRPGDRIVTSGNGGVFPADILVGTVVEGADRRLRVRLAADYERLRFLRVLRAHPQPPITEPGGLILPEEAALLDEASDG